MVRLTLTNDQALKLLEFLHGPSTTDPVLMDVFKHVTLRLMAAKRPKPQRDRLLAAIEAAIDAYDETQR